MLFTVSSPSSVSGSSPKSSDGCSLVEAASPATSPVSVAGATALAGGVEKREAVGAGLTDCGGVVDGMALEKKELNTGAGAGAGGGADSGSGAGGASGAAHGDGSGSEASATSANSAASACFGSSSFARGAKRSIMSNLLRFSCEAGCVPPVGMLCFKAEDNPPGGIGGGDGGDINGELEAAWLAASLWNAGLSPVSVE